MATWYCSSAKHAAVPQFAISTAYSVGNFVRQLAAPTAGNERVWRCTTAGTSAGSEPAWTLTKGSTTNSGSAVFTEVTGNSTYGWSAPHASMTRVWNWSADGDDAFVGSDHNYSIAATNNIKLNDARTLAAKWVSVNTAGSFPPVAADVQSGAKETTTGNNTITVDGTAYLYGLEVVTGSGASGTASISIDAAAGYGATVFDTCKWTIATTGVSSRINVYGAPASDNSGEVTWKNCTVKFGATAQGVTLAGPARLRWIGGSVDSAGSAPSTLFNHVNNTGSQVHCEGVDLSHCGSGTLVAASGNSDSFLFSNCRFGASYVLASLTAGTTYGGPEVVAVNCSSGTANYIDEKHNRYGNLTTEATIVRTGGSNDGTTTKSWKVVTGTKASWTYPFECIKRAVWNDTTGSARTLTVEIENDGTTLKDSEVWVDVDYLGSGSYPLSSRVSSKSATILTTGSNLTTSSETWTTTGQGGPVKQKVSVTFTPEMKGYIYYTVCIAKASQTLYVDPKASLT